MGYNFAHLADVHWRGLTRHGEYRRSFADAFKKMKSQNLDAIFIVGDIVHSKTQGISPELIDSLCWWFRQFNSIAPTYVTLGNHDGLILNKDRQDAITPIITALDLPNIHLVKNTEVLEGALSKEGCESVNLINYSCFDEDGWEKVKLPESGINIALYHGAVFGSKTDSDWELDGEIEYSFFDSHDFVFLGDIHKHQYIDDDETIAYCGSTIQQNFGEDPGKGYMLWDIDSKDKYRSEHIEVKHDRPFVTVDWKGSVQATIDEAEAHPDRARFRIRTNIAISQGEIKQLYSSLKEYKNASEIVMKYDVPKGIHLQESFSKEEKLDLRDPNVVAKLICKYYEKAGISDRIKNRLSDLVHSLWKNVRKSDGTTGQKWSLHSLEFDNTFGYGKDNIINFDAIEGITGIFGRNRTGKSSIPGTMMYTLFNTTDRGAMSNLYVVNTRKGHCKSSAVISSAGSRYKIERQTVKRQSKRGDLSATTQLNLLELDSNGNVIKDLCGEQRRETEKVLRTIVGESEDFLLTSMASQGEMNAFLKQKASARKTVLTRFLELDVFDFLHAAAREESAGVKAALKGVPDREYEVAIIDSKNKLRTRERARDEAYKTLEATREKIRDIELALATRDDTSLVTLVDVDDQRTRVADLKSKLGTDEKKFQSLLLDLSDTEEKIDKLKVFRESFPIAELKVSIEEQRSLENTVSSIKHSIDKEKHRLKTFRREAEKLGDVPCSDVCPVNKYVKGALKAKKEVEKQSLKIEDLKEDLKITRRGLKKLLDKNLEQKLSKYEDLIEKYSELSSIGNGFRLDISDSENSLEKLRGEIKLQEKTLSEMAANIAEEDSVKELTALRNDLQELRNNRSQSEMNCSQLSESIGLLQSDIKKLTEEKKQFDSLVEQWRVFELFLQATSKNGVPLSVIRSRLPEINSEISSILQGVTGFTVELESQEGSADMQIYINYGDSKRTIECCSGMEKMMSALAIRVALINVSNLPKPDMIILDEGFGSLDSGNIEACNRFLESLKKWFRIILVISHVDAVKDGVDNTLEITRSGPDAKIVYEKRT